DLDPRNVGLSGPLDRACARAPRTDWKDRVDRRDHHHDSRTPQDLAVPGPSRLAGRALSKIRLDRRHRGAPQLRSATYVASRVARAMAGCRLPQGARQAGAEVVPKPPVESLADGPGLERRRAMMTAFQRFHLLLVTAILVPCLAGACAAAPSKP